jgi:hypothetical protein
MLKIPANQRKLQDVAISIIEDLELLQELVRTRQSDIEAQKLRDAISSLETYVPN